MANINSSLPSLHELNQQQNRGDEQIRQMVKDIAKDRGEIQQLRNLDVAQLSPAARTQLAQMLAEQLRGQLPPNLARALTDGSAGPASIEQLISRLVNQQKYQLTTTAMTPEAARDSAGDPSLPQQALQWARFVQKAQHVPGAQLQDRAGVMAPKGEGAILNEILGGASSTGLTGPGLRSPSLVMRPMSDLSPMQRLQLMTQTFGPELAARMMELGIDDPLLFVKAGGLPSAREGLAEALGLSRDKLLGLLMRAELLKIGPGRNGELPIRPEFLAALKDAGIAMLGTMAALRGLSFEELTLIFKRLRERSGGFSNAMRGAHVPAKRDLIHWARTAARKKSDILFGSSEDWDAQQGMGRGDAQELIQAWYLENLLWTELDNAKRRSQREQQRVLYERDRQQQEDQRRDREQREDTGWVDDGTTAELEVDESRNDQLMCFWITDHVPSDGVMGAGLRRMYVCVDPLTGAIIPQYIEREQASAP